MPNNPSYKELNQAIKEQNLEMVKKYFSQGVKPKNYENSYIKNPLECSLHLAIESGNYQTVKLCFEGGAIVANDVKWKDDNNSVNYSCNTLHLAIKTNNEKIVEICLKEGAKIINDAKKTNGDHCLFYNSLYEAIETKNPKIVALVLKYGAKVINHRGHSLNMAIKSGSDKIINLILLHEGDINSLPKNSGTDINKLYKTQNSLLSQKKLFENSVMIFSNKFGNRFNTNEIIERILQFTVDDKDVTPANSVRIIKAAQAFEFKDKSR